MSLSAICLANLLVRNASQNGKSLSRNFSRKSVYSDGSFKAVKPRKSQKHETTLAWRDPNFDILASRCFPFFMPGNVGPAWYDTYTTIKNDQGFVMKEIDKKHKDYITCKIQSCPTVLRNTVCDLFPFRNLDHSELSVITLTIKPDLKVLKKNLEIETEKLAQLFVLTAKNVCSKLRRGGFWADFVNPFSGRPYFSIQVTDKLYSSDEKFRCLDFQINEISKCLVVSNEQDNLKREFIGSLFTNAPCNECNLKKIFNVDGQQLSQA